jgi:hypothetical protein
LALAPANLYKEIVEIIAIDYTKAISILSVRKVFWSDLSCRERVSRIPRRLNYLQADEIQTLPENTKLQQAKNREL